MRTPVWTRPAFDAPGRRQAFELVCCAPGPVDLSQGSPAALRGWAPLDSIPESVDLEVDPRPWDAPWGDRVRDTRWTTDELDPALGRRLGETRTTLHVLVDAPDGPDLVALQSAWALVRWLVDLGAFAVLDVAAMRWWSAADVVGWGSHRPLSVPREVHEAVYTSARWEVRLTRGMVKFGRPDLLTLLPNADDPLVEGQRQLLRAAALRAARGETLRPGDRVDTGFHAAEVFAYRPGVVDLGFPLDPALVLAGPPPG